MIKGVEHPAEKRMSFFWPNAEGSKDLLLIDKKRFYHSAVTDSERAATIFKEQLHSVSFSTEEKDRPMVEWQKHNLVNLFHREYLSNQPNFRQLRSLVRDYGLSKVNSEAISYYCTPESIDQEICDQFLALVAEGGYSKSTNYEIAIATISTTYNLCTSGDLSNCRHLVGEIKKIHQSLGDLISSSFFAIGRDYLINSLYKNLKDHNQENSNQILSILHSYPDFVQEYESSRSINHLAVKPFLT